MPSFLSLPPELRTIIFELALAHDLPFSISGIYPDYHGRGATATLKRSHLAPTQINRLLRHEALPIFYSINTFTICLQPVCVKFIGARRRDGKVMEIFRRSYGDRVMAGWFKMLPSEAVREIRMLRVYVACVTRWRGDEGFMEREKCKAYEVAEAKTRRMTTHVLYDMCSGSRLFYEVDLEGEGVEGFVEVFGDERDGDGDGEEGVWGGDECEVCLSVLRRWLASVGYDEGGRKRVSRAKLEELVW